VLGTVKTFVQPLREEDHLVGVRELGPFLPYGFLGVALAEADHHAEGVNQKNHFVERKS